MAGWYVQWAPEEEDLFKINSDFEDEEINEDEAFGEEDEEKFGDWFASEGNVDGVDEDGDEDFDEVSCLLSNFSLIFISRICVFAQTFDYWKVLEHK